MGVSAASTTSPGKTHGPVSLQNPQSRLPAFLQSNEAICVKNQDYNKQSSSGSDSGPAGNIPACRCRVGRSYADGSVSRWPLRLLLKLNSDSCTPLGKHLAPLRRVLHCGKAAIIFILCCSSSCSGKHSHSDSTAADPSPAGGPAQQLPTPSADDLWWRRRQGTARATLFKLLSSLLGFKFSDLSRESVL